MKEQSEGYWDVSKWTASQRAAAYHAGFVCPAVPDPEREKDCGDDGDDRGIQCRIDDALHG